MFHLRRDEFAISCHHRDRSYVSEPQPPSKSELPHEPVKLHFGIPTAFSDSSRPDKFAFVSTTAGSHDRGETVQRDLGAVSTRAFSSFHMPSGDAGMTSRMVKPEPVSSYVVPQSTSNDHKVNDLFCGNRVSQFVMHSRDSDHSVPRVVSDLTRGGYHAPTVDTDLTRGRSCVYVDSHLGDHDHHDRDLNAYDAVDACPTLGPAQLWITMCFLEWFLVLQVNQSLVSVWFWTSWQMPWLISAIVCLRSVLVSLAVIRCRIMLSCEALTPE